VNKVGIRNLCPCDCSGTLNFLAGAALYSANICPFCDALGSFVTITSPEGGTSFQSTVVNPSSCVTTAGGTTLVASGEGLLNGEPVGFTITLFESIDNDAFTITFQRLTDTGQIFFTISTFLVPDGDLTITEC
jgi:hypothetical protein